MADKQTIQKLLPYAEEAEQGILGSILIDPNMSMTACLHEIGKDYEAFYDPRHKIIYKILVDMYEAGKKIDLVTLINELKDRNKLLNCGGMEYIVSLPSLVPSAANIDYYLKIVTDKYLLRKIIIATTEISNAAMNGVTDIDDFIDKTGNKIFTICSERIKRKERHLKTILREIVDRIEMVTKNENANSIYLKTGYSDLDALLGGLKKGDMIVIAARPSIGKTSFVMNVVENILIKFNRPVCIFSFEMSAESLLTRLISSMSRINMKSVFSGYLTDDICTKLFHTIENVSKLPLYIDDACDMTILELKAKARNFRQKYGVDLFVIDYLQLIHSSKRYDTRNHELADISRNIKILAKELDVPIIVVSQLNREVEKDRNRKPRLSDLRESGAIEQDADIIGFLYRATADEEIINMKSASYPVNLYIAKQRNGPIGEVRFIFFPQYTRFEQAVKYLD